MHGSPDNHGRSAAAGSASAGGSASGSAFSFFRARDRLHAKSPPRSVRKASGGKGSGEGGKGSSSGGKGSGGLSPTRRLGRFGLGGAAVPFSLGGEGGGGEGAGGITPRMNVGSSLLSSARQPIDTTPAQRAAVSLFADFLAAKQATDVVTSFASLLSHLADPLAAGTGSAALTSLAALIAVDASSPSPSRLSHVAASLSHLLPHRSRSLLAALQTRAARPHYHLLQPHALVADLGISAVRALISQRENSRA